MTSVLSLNTVLSQESSQQEKKKKEPLSKWSKQWLEEVFPYIIFFKYKNPSLPILCKDIKLKNGMF